MDKPSIWEQLERVGVVRRGHFEVGDYHTEFAPEGLEPLANPKAAQALSEQLASIVSDASPDMVLAWAGMSSILLGFLVGVNLDRPVLRLADDEGLVYASGEVGRGQRAVLVGDRLRERDIRLARAYVESKGASLVRLAALVDDGSTPDVLALASMGSKRYPPESCPICRQGIPLVSQTTGAAVG